MNVSQDDCKPSATYLFDVAIMSKDASMEGRSGETRKRHEVISGTRIP
jgi:hypothetical protein